jgi:hypothetical protein
MACQLTAIEAIKKPNSPVNDALQMRVKILRPAKRKAKFLKNWLMSSLSPQKKNRKTTLVRKSEIKGGTL